MTMATLLLITLLLPLAGALLLHGDRALREGRS